MSKYFPLHAVDKILIENLEEGYRQYVQHGVLPEDFTMDEIRTFIFGDDFFNPNYQGKYTQLNEECMFNVKLNKTYFPNLRLKDISQRKIEWNDVWGMPLAVDAWTKYKLVYKIDNDFFQEIANTENLMITKDMLLHLPAMTLYIDLSDAKNIDPFEGAWLHINDCQNGIINIAIYMITSNFVTFSYYLSGNFKEKNELPCFVSKLQKNENFVIRDINENFEVSTIKMTQEDKRQEIVRAILQIMAFLSVSAEDITENEITKTTYKQPAPEKIKNKWSEVQMWDVGVRYGAAIHLAKEKVKKWQKENSGTEQGEHKARKPMKPHVRCAHWHRYHTGAGRQNTIIKWIPPVYVCGGKEISVKLLPATIHEIKK